MNRITSNFHFRRRPGFTLIEVLVVLSIISVLIALLLPSLKRARESAMMLRESSNMRQFGYGLMRYQNDNKDWVLGYRTPKPADGADFAFWWSIVMGYGYVDANGGAGNLTFFGATSTNPAKDTIPPLRCLLDTPDRFNNVLVRKPYTDTGGTDYIQAGSSGNSRYWLSFSINGFMGDGGALATYPLQRASKVRKAPSELVYFTCGDKTNRVTSLATWTGTNMFRHDDKTVTLFLDGHVSPVVKEFILDVEQLKP